MGRWEDEKCKYCYNLALNTSLNMRLLLISNSSMPGEEYLRYPMPEIGKSLGNQPLNAVFYKNIPDKYFLSARDIFSIRHAD